MYENALNIYIHLSRRNQIKSLTSFELQDNHHVQPGDDNKPVVILIKAIVPKQKKIHIERTFNIKWQMKK